jgi:hypothetical protein
MAYHRVVRDGGHRYPPWVTPTSDEDDYAQETATSLVNKETQESLTVYIPQIPASIPPTSTPMSYTSSMPDRTQDGGVGKPPWESGPPQKTMSDEDNSKTYTHSSHTPTPTPTTLSTTSSAYDSLTSSTISATPTRSAGDIYSPAPTNSGLPGLQSKTDDGPNRTPMYAAAGITPVVVVIVGFVVFFLLRKRRRQRQAVNEQEHIEEMKMHQKLTAMPYIAPITPPSPPPAAYSQYSPSTPPSHHPPTASSSQPIILGPIPSGNNGAYLTGMDTSDLISMTSAGGVSRQGTIVDRDPFADGRSLEEAPPPYRPSSLPPVSVASTSRNSSLRVAAPPNILQLVENPFGDPEDDEISVMSGPTLRGASDAMSDVSELSYQLDPVVGRSPF